MMTAIFTIALFLSAFLLFCLELMVGKMLLPIYGGSAAVWTTCLCFFQFSLLAGYSYSHWVNKSLNIRSQILGQFILLIVGGLTIPIGFSPNNITNDLQPQIIDLFTALITEIGLPFLLLATIAPLLQKWFSYLSTSTNDPYFLYAASNAGSLLGVIGYPLLIEPNLTISQQTYFWSIGYIILGLIILLSSGLVWYKKIDIKFPPPPVKPSIDVRSFPWLVLSFIPSSLLLGITNYLTTDIAAIPLLWSLPLALYLLTFILAFSSKIIFNLSTIENILPFTITPLIIISLLMVNQPVLFWLTIHLINFCLIAYYCHRRLNQLRPETNYLTAFYWWISLGGALGGIFNAIVAPLIFHSILEYPLVLALTLLIILVKSPIKIVKNIDNKDLITQLYNPEISFAEIKATQPNQEITQEPENNNLNLFLSVGLLIGSLLVGFRWQGINNNILGITITIALFTVIIYNLKLPPWRYITAGIITLLICQFTLPSLGNILITERSFFGVNRVVNDPQKNLHILLHGNTVHGRQNWQSDRQLEPLTYFHYASPIGQLFQEFAGKFKHIGVLGLGVGTLFTYSEPHQQWTFYEIDPVVTKIANDPKYFTFLTKKNSPPQIILGDGRLALKQSADRTYDLLIMDAFSSDSIPVHLITQEAIEIYLKKLTEHGLLVINISNRYLDIQPVLTAVSNQLNLVGIHQEQINIPDSEKALGKSASHWVVLAKSKEDLAPLNQNSWQSLNNPKTRVWTDDFSNLFSVIKGLW